MASSINLGYPQIYLTSTTTHITTRIIATKELGRVTRVKG